MSKSNEHIKDSSHNNVKYEKLINFYSFARSLQNFSVEVDIESLCKRSNHIWK